MSRPKNVQEFLDKYWWSARLVSEKAGLFTSIMLAQAGLESAWGKKVGQIRSGTKANAFFGHQVLDYCKQQASLPTVQSGVAQQGGFCIYSNFVEAAEGWVSLIEKAPQFLSVRKSKKDYERFISTLAVAYNATGFEKAPPNEKPEQKAARMRRAHANYAAQLRQVINGFQLKEYDRIAGPTVSASDSAGKIAIGLLATSPPDYMGATRGLWNGWMKYLLNNALPEVDLAGKLQPLLAKIDKNDDVRRSMLREKGDGLYRFLIAVRAVRLKSEESDVAVDDLKAKLKNDEKRVFSWLEKNYKDQSQDIENFLVHGPRPI